MAENESVYAIVGATGNVGRPLAERLLEAGKTVRVVGRSAERLQPFTDRGAEPFAGNVEDAEFMGRVLDGVDALFSTIPPNLDAEDIRAYQHRVSDVTTSAVRASNVKHVVCLSSVGAQHPKGTGFIAGLHYHEQNLNGLDGINVIHLRAAFFMENFLMNIPMIRDMGFMGGPVYAHIVAPMIATTDIAEAAARHLLDLDFSGKTVVELLGQRDLMHEEAAAILGAAIGRPDLRYQQFPYGDVENALIGMGLNRSAVDLYIEMADGLNNGLVAPTEVRSAGNTTATSIEEFSKVFAAAFNNF